MASESLVIHEIYLSIQGESTYAGLPCVFVRLTACNLRCSYCDTAYAFSGGSRRSLEEIMAEVSRLAERYGSDRGEGHRMPLVELTGGEPLLQPGALVLMERLCEEGFTVLLETSGAHDISRVDPRVHRIMDLKCPSSGEVSRNRWENIVHLRATDEVKFVMGSWEDYEWAKEQLHVHRLAERARVLFSWVHPLTDSQRDPSLKPVPEGQRWMSRQELVEKMVHDALPVRFQLQMHKIIWPPDQKGV